MEDFTVGCTLDSPGRIALSSRTFSSISSGNQSGPDFSFLRAAGTIYKVYQSSGLVTISTISPYLSLSRFGPHFPLSLDGSFSSTPTSTPPSFFLLLPSIPRASALCLTRSLPTLLRFSTSLKVLSSRNYESLYTTSLLDYFLLELSTGKGPTGRTVECKCKSKLEGRRATLG